MLLHREGDRHADAGGGRTLRVPHGPTCTEKATCCAVSPAHDPGDARDIRGERARVVPAADTHRGFGVRGGTARVPTARAGPARDAVRSRRPGNTGVCAQKIDADAVNATQDLALVFALELASKKKIKRKIGAVATRPEAVADAAHFLELAKTAAQTLKAVCTLYEWRDFYVAALPRRGRREIQKAGRRARLGHLARRRRERRVRSAAPRPRPGRAWGSSSPSRRSRPPGRSAGAARAGGAEGARGRPGAAGGVTG